MNAQANLALILAQAPPDAPGGQGEDFGKASPLGLVLMILLGIGIVLLVLSMSRHLKKVPHTFDEERAAAAAPARSKRAAAGSSEEDEEQRSEDQPADQKRTASDGSGPADDERG